MEAKADLPVGRCGGFLAWCRYWSLAEQARSLAAATPTRGNAGRTAHAVAGSVAVAARLPGLTRSR